MIRENEVFKIGKLIKPHGIKGEIAFAFDNDVFDKVDCPYLICLVDGILVPFFVEAHRFKGEDTALIKFEDMNSAEEVRKMSHIEVYFPRAYFEEEEEAEIDYSWNYFIGFSVVDANDNTTIGTIDAIDESTINVLLLVIDDNDDEFLIPASEDFMTEVDDKNKILKMNLPEGLFDE